MFNFLGYIDPGTGSMLFTVIIGVATAAIFAARGLFIKFKYKLHRRNAKADKDKIPFVIFTDSKRYWNVFEPICDEFEKRGVHCEYWTMSPDDPALEAKYEYVKGRFIGEGNAAFSKLNLMKATVCLATTPSLDVLQWKRSKDVDYYVYIFHDHSDGLGYKWFALDYYDAILANGSVPEPVVRKLEAMRNHPPKEIRIVGCTYMDRLLKKKEALGTCEEGEKTVLLAPSWGASSLLNKYGEKIIQSLVDTGYKIIIRPHPQSKTSEAELLERLEAKFPPCEGLEWNYDNDNFEVLSKASILISDYSSVMVDYAFIFDRPFIYTEVEFDKRPYDAVWVEDTPWHFAVLEKIGKSLREEDIPNMKNVIDSVLESDVYAAGRRESMEEEWMYRGEAAVRAVDFLLEKYNELTEDPETGEAGTEAEPEK